MVFEQQLAGLGLTYGNNDNGRTEAVTAVDFDSNGGGLKVFDMWKNCMIPDILKITEQQQQIPRQHSSPDRLA